ncbi:hypothetical protein D3C76_1677480 [compost metagenome]
MPSKRQCRSVYMRELPLPDIYRDMSGAGSGTAAGKVMFAPAIRTTGLAKSILFLYRWSGIGTDGFVFGRIGVQPG